MRVPPGLSGPEASAWSQRQRLRFDAMRWTAAKLRPRAYGDHVQLDVNVSQQISIQAALEQANARVIEGFPYRQALADVSLSKSERAD